MKKENKDNNTKEGNERSKGMLSFDNTVWEMNPNQLMTYTQENLEKANYEVKHYKMAFDGSSKGWMLLVHKDNPKPKVFLVAHLDKVGGYTQIAKTLAQGKHNNIIRAYNDKGERCILGADDRAGVVAITRICQFLDKYKDTSSGTKKFPDCIPGVLLFDGEESGGKGVTDFCKEYKNPFGDAKFLIELDREDTNGLNYVVYNHRSMAVEAVMEQLGVAEGIGCYSDVDTLSEYWEIPHINMSIGYKNQHGKKEELDLIQWTESIKTTIRLLYTLFEEDGIIDELDYTYEPWGGYGGYHSYGYSPYDDYDLEEYDNYKGYSKSNSTKGKIDPIIQNDKEEVYHYLDEFYEGASGYLQQCTCCNVENVAVYEGVCFACYLIRERFMAQISMKKYIENRERERKDKEEREALETAKKVQELDWNKVDQENKSENFKSDNEDKKVA